MQLGDRLCGLTPSGAGVQKRGEISENYTGWDISEREVDWA